jgi:hypothetical protein
VGSVQSVGARPHTVRSASRGGSRLGGVRDVMMVPRAHVRPVGGPGRRGEGGGTPAAAWRDAPVRA